MPRQRWVPNAPFMLATGGTSEGRPDLISLLQAREPHETLVHEAEALRRKERLENRATKSPRSKKSSEEGLNELLGNDPALAAALANGLAQQTARGAVKAEVAVPNAEPLAHPRPPTSVGCFRARDAVLETRAATAHAQMQHEAPRWKREESVGLAAFESAMSGTRPNTVLPHHLNIHRQIAGIENALATTGGTPGGQFVRIGVPVTVSTAGVYIEAAPLGGGGGGSGAIGNSKSGTRSMMRTGGGGSAQSPDGGGGQSRVNFIPAMSGMPQEATLGRGLGIGLDQISFRHATADLPPAATLTVRDMLADRRPVTVEGIHQRRPPYFDLGPKVDPRDTRIEIGPDRFPNALRQYSSNAQVSRNLFKIGSAPSWATSQSGGKYRQTFDFMAKFTGQKYYQSDFAELNKFSVRPPQTPATAPDLGPSFLYRPGVDEVRDQRLNMKEGDIDSSIRYNHADKHVLPRKRITVPGAHLLPYPNAAQLFQ